MKTPDDSGHGFYIVCDVNYTNSCKERTEQLALMPNERKINDNELGYRERGKGKTKTEKLIFDQNNKTEYMVHYRMLNFYVMMGVKVTKIHRVIKIKHDYIYANKTKEKAVKKHSNAKYKEYYDAIRYNTQRTVDECKIQKVGDRMTTTKTSKFSLHIFDNRRFYVNKT